MLLGDTSATKEVEQLLIVVVNEEKTGLLKDIEDFLDEEICGWYSKPDILYGKVLLLCGRAGTRKFNLSLFVAGRFSLYAYIYY